MAHITKQELDNLCETLRAADADIRDIVMFGSFVYAPSLARDIDLVVTTAKRKDYDVYLDAVADFPMNVDVIARQPGEAIGDRIAWGIKAVGQVLAGDGQTLEEVMKVPPPTFENVRRLFVRADENWESAKQEQNPFPKEMTNIGIVLTSCLTSPVMLLWLTSTANKRDGGSCAVHYLNLSRSDLGKLLTRSTSAMVVMAIIPQMMLTKNFSVAEIWWNSLWTI